MNVTDFTDFLNAPLATWIWHRANSDEIPNITATFPHNMDCRLCDYQATFGQGDTVHVEFEYVIGGPHESFQLIIAFLNGRPYASLLSGIWYLGYPQYNGEFIR